MENKGENNKGENDDKIDLSMGAYNYILILKFLECCPDLFDANLIKTVIPEFNDNLTSYDIVNFRIYYHLNKVNWYYSLVFDVGYASNDIIIINNMVDFIEFR